MKTLSKEFMELYKDKTETQLKFKNGLTKAEFCEGLFPHDLTLINTGKIELLVAKIDAKPIAFATCLINKYTGNVYLSLFAVEKSFQGCGIGGLIIKEINQRYKNFKGIDLCTRRINQSGISFYQRLKFKPKEVKELHLHYDSEVYIGFELTGKDRPSNCAHSIDDFRIFKLR